MIFSFLSRSGFCQCKGVIRSAILNFLRLFQFVWVLLFFRPAAHWTLIGWSKRRSPGVVSFIRWCFVQERFLHAVMGRYISKLKTFSVIDLGERERSLPTFNRSFGSLQVYGSISSEILKLPRKCIYNDYLLAVICFSFCYFFILLPVCYFRQ